MNVPFYANPLGQPLCGPAALKMVLGFYGIDTELEALAVDCCSKITGTLSTDLVAASHKYGLKAELIDGMRSHDLTLCLSNGMPVIALVDPRVLYNVIGPPGHFVVTVEIDDMDIRYHDPDIGSNMVVAIDAFEDAWEAKGRKAVRIWK